MKKNWKKILIFASAILFLGAAHFALAQVDLGVNTAESIGLGKADPKVLIVNIVRVALGFLGLVAIIIIMYGGWIWMTAGGNQEKIDQAKKLLRNAVIGLIIILSAFGIVSYILIKIMDIGEGGGDGTVCDPPCSSGQYCCGSVCGSEPCGSVDPSGTGVFRLSGTAPRNNDSNVIRNVVIRAYFNKPIDPATSQAGLENNFRVENLGQAAYGGKTKNFLPRIIAFEALAQSSLTGAVATSSGWQEINFRPLSGCDDERNTPNCLPSNSQIRVTINGASGIISAGRQSLSCYGGNCQFTFSTGDLIDAGPPVSGIVPAQICKDDGQLKSDSNLVGGWGRDDIALAKLEFFEQRVNESGAPLGDNNLVGPVVNGNGANYVFDNHRYDTAGMQVNDWYAFSVSARDLADQESVSVFKTQIKPGHCCNGEKDIFGEGDPRNEEETDCGGADCLACAGGACNLGQPNQCTLNGDPNCSDNLCSTWFCPRTEDCVDDECLCRQKPMITGVTPAGGFCDGGTNKFCRTDAECEGLGDGKCNLTAPNGAPGNLITIHGKYFGSTRGRVYFSGSNESWIEAKLADDATSGNPVCADKVWQDKEIIAIVPEGALAGPLKVAPDESYFDQTDDQYGPRLDDFLVNTVIRPGICKLDPAHGIMNAAIMYYGIKLNGAASYFGNLADNLAGLESNFNEKNGQAKIPNINTGLVSTFAENEAGVYSNFLNFTKDPEPYAGPLIESFDPKIGASGQYVTIRGRGFGNSRGESQVFFGSAENGVEAFYNFPDACANSVWGDNQIIVKVPGQIDNGQYLITIKIPGLTIDTSDLAAPKFTVSSSEALKPSICKLAPEAGTAGTQVDFWGEYFGNKDDNSKVRFYLNKTQSGLAISSWATDTSAAGLIKPDFVTTTVPTGSITGPVYLIKGSPEARGNGLNFKVGECSESSQCGENFVCCPSGSPSDGRCLAFEKDAAGQVVKNTAADLCYGNYNSCVYEWDFSTSQGGVGSPCKPSAESSCLAGACQEGLSCDSSGGGECGVCKKTCGSYPACDNESCDAGQGEKCVTRAQPNGSSICACEITPDSCSGYDIGQCNDTLNCPNSPGSCSSHQAGEAVATGSCDFSCADAAGCQDQNGNNLCHYDSQLNKCASGYSCGLSKPGPVAGLTATCSLYNLSGRWKINYNQTCPSGWTRIYGNQCVQEGEAGLCGLCSNPFVCTGSGETGVCAINKNICPSGSACDANNKCVKADSARCECCCDKNQNTQSGNPACCSPLQCDNTCGAGENMGLCSGCADVGTTQEQHDASCNCTGTSGKFCDMSVSGGVCRDCAEIGSAADCSAHSSACCVNGGTTGNGIACQALTTGGGTISEGNLSYCAYYKCSNEIARSCDINAPAKAGGAGTTYPYLTQNCNNACGQAPGGSCYDKNTSNCSLICEQPDTYQCYGETGCKDSNPTPPPPACSAGDGSCLCCCNPSDDKCGLIDTKDPNTQLACEANKSPCTSEGDERGLCCGCSQDLNCGNPETAACGLDSCCRSRPDILDRIGDADCHNYVGGDVKESCGGDELLATDDPRPYNGTDDVCRNAIISANFNQVMDISSFTGNVIVAGEYPGECPKGTTYLALNDNPGPKNLLEKVYARIAGVFKRLLAFAWPGQNALALDPPNPEYNYCALPGRVSGLQNSNQTTKIIFTPSALMDPGVRYFVIINGDADLNSLSGVLTLYKNGMNGPGNILDPDTIQSTIADEYLTFNGRKFVHPYIWSFITLGKQAENNGVCEVDHASIIPSSNLFQTNKNDITDDNATDKNFDSVKDSDKVFSAQAWDKNDQALAPLPGVYAWDWIWENNASFLDGLEAVNSCGTSGEESCPDEKIARVNSEKVEGEGEIAVTATLTDGAYKLCGGVSCAASAKVYLLVCENPWPAIDPQTGLWRPWNDNPGETNCSDCADPDNCPDCLDTNFEIYYCRDKGNAGTIDDLPAISNEAMLKKSDERGILKEVYYLRGQLPGGGYDLFNLEAIADPAGEKAELSWNNVLADDATIDYKAYKVYYGISSGEYIFNKTLDIVSQGADINQVNCASDRCGYTLSALTNGQTYYLAVASLNKDDGTESPLSEEISVRITDATGPAKVEFLSATPGDGKVVLERESSDEAEKYQIFYKALDQADCADEKTGSINFGASVSADSSDGITTVKSLANDIGYCFGLVAYDRSGNPSATSTIFAIPEKD